MSASLRSAMTVVAASAAVLAVAATPATANVRVDDIPMPAYARIAGPAVDGGIEEVFHDDEWAAIPFYRPPACVPPGFNLLGFFDIPAVFGCGQMTIEMATIWRNAPGTDDAPIQITVKGLGAVPVWFVRWPELQTAIDDGTLTIGELAALPSLLVGSADFYTETIHPTQAAKVPFLAFVARGTLEDSRQFQVEATRSGGAGRVTHVAISFR